MQLDRESLSLSLSADTCVPFIVDLSGEFDTFSLEILIFSGNWKTERKNEKKKRFFFISVEVSQMDILWVGEEIRQMIRYYTDYAD